jgi:hypothetical protein
MADMNNKVQTSATEAKIGKLHDRVTDLMLTKSDLILEEIDEAESSEDKSFAINLNDIAIMGRWVTSNGVGALASSDEKGNALKDQLDQIREKNRQKRVIGGDE